jgi:hypothetical protein
MRRTIAAIAAAAALAGAAYSQDSSITVDENALFGDEAADTVEAVPQGKAEAAVSTFLKTEAVRIGGSFSGSVGADWTMDTPWTDPSLDAYGLSTTVAGDLFFDARPSEDFRVYGKIKASYPFSTTESFLTSATYKPAVGPIDPYIATKSGSVTTPNLNVFELFADWNYKDRVFLRFGKHTVKWGVGYFFSPADIINVGAIDPLNPEAQREGPVSLRLNYPVLGTQTNLWAYAVMPQGEDPKPEDIAGAAKLEFLVAKSWEIGVGGYYKYDHPPRAMVTASGSFWKLNVFGEAVGAWGSDKSFVTDVDSMTPGFYTSEKRKDELFFSGTAGFSYSNSDDNWSIAAQYLYSGEGYADDDREALIDDARSNQSAIEAALAGTGVSYSDLLKGLILNSGRNYAALSLSKSELFCEDLSVGALVWANLSDFSGFARPYVSWKLFDKTSIELSSTFVFGSSDSEYVVLNDGPALTLGLKASLGSGSF